MAGNIYDDALDQLPPSPLDANPYTDAVKEATKKRIDQQRISIDRAADTQPDRAADVIALSKRFNLPPSVVDRNFDTLQKRARQADTPHDQILRETPALAKYLSDPYQAAAVGEDRDALGVLEKTVRVASNSFRTLASGPPRGVAELMGLLESYAEANGNTQLAAVARMHRQEGLKDAAFVKGAQAGAGGLEQAFYAGFESVGVMLPGAVLSLMSGTPLPMLAMAGATTAGESYGRGREKGLSVDRANVHALIQSGVEVATELIPMKWFLKDLLAGSGFGKMVLRQLKSEIPGEQLATIFQDADEFATFNPEAPWSQYLAERPSAFAQTLVSTMTSVGAMTAIGSAAAAAADSHPEVARAEQSKGFFDTIAQTVKSMATAEKHPQSIETVIGNATAGTSVEHLYAPIDTFTTYWQDKGEDPAAMAAQLTGDPRAYAIALRTGQDLAIPTATYAARLATSEHNEFFVNELRLGPDEMNLREATAFKEQQAAAAQAQADTTAIAESPAAAMAVELRQNLERAGFERSTAATYADLAESVIGEIATRTGVDPSVLIKGIAVDRPDLSQPEAREPRSPLAKAGETIPREEAVRLGLDTATEVEAAAATRGSAADIPDTDVARRLEAERGAPATPEELARIEAERVAAPAPAIEDLDESQDDQSIREWKENADRVAANPEAATRKDLLRAASYLDAVKRSYIRKAQRGEIAMPAQLLDSIDAEIANYDRLAVLLDKKAEGAETTEGTEDAGTEQGPNRLADQSRSTARHRVPASDPGDGKRAGERATKHLARVFEAVLANARDIDPNVNEAELKAEFDWRVTFYLDQQTLAAESGTRPHDILRAIAAYGGISTDPNAERAAEIRQMMGGSIPAFGKVAGVTGVFGAPRKGDPAKKRKTRGLSIDVLLQSLHQDPEFQWIESVDMLLDQIDEAARHAEDTISASELPGTEELRDVAIDGERKWWARAWRPINLLEDEVSEAEIEGAVGDTSFDVTEFSQGLFDEFNALQDPKDEDTLATGEVQPRLPEAGQVREQEQATPEIAELPFALTAPTGKPQRKKGPIPGQTTLFQEQGVTNESVREWAAATKTKAGPNVKRFDVSLTNEGDLSLDSLIVERGAQRAGLGSKVMRELTRFADANGLRIVLTPGQRDEHHGTTSRGRLVKFYKRFGFVENKGRHKDFAISAGMFREPTLPALTAPVRSDRLLIQHNLSAAKLAHALKLGALPVPSLAITKADDAMTNFGEITLIGNRAMATPGPDTKVFAADVYAPRYPTVHYKIDRAGEKTLADALTPYNDVAQRNWFDLDSLQKEGARYLQREEPRVKAAFLDSIGMLDRDGLKQLADSIEDDRNSRRMFTVQRALEDAIRDNKLDAQFEEFADTLFASLKPTEQIFRGFTNQGNRSYTPHTIENVVKELRKNLRGGESESNIYGVGQLRSKFTPQFKTLAGIQKARDLVVSDADFEKVKKEVEEELFAIAKALTPYYEHDADRFGFVDTVMAVMADAPRMGLVRALRDYGFTDVPADTQTAIGDYLQKLRTLPTEYFEAKITRAVGLQEFTAAVVPSDLKPELKQRLIEAGLQVEEYESGKQDQRKQAIVTLTARIGEEVLFQDPPEGGGRRGAIRFGPERQFTISLLEKADLTTFLHESGHMFLEIFGDAVDQIRGAENLTELQQKAIADYDTLLEWFGVESRAAITVEHHEQFARGFEAYLMEGRAPSVKMRDAFARFRAWLIGVYRSIKGLRVSLTPEVRRVLDRMVASDAEIAIAEAQGNVTPMFTTAADAGMTPEEFQLYRATVAEASNAAREQLTMEMLAEVRREQEATWKAQRAEIRTAVEAETHAMPVYIALAAMQRGTTPAGDPMWEGAKPLPIKLSRKILVDRFGEDRLKTLPLPYVYTRDGGIDPDVAATMFGYSSGDELLKALAGAEPMKRRIERETDRRMIEQHGSMLLDGTVPEKAKAALANDHREKIMRAELRALARKRREVGPFVRAAVKAERQESQEEIEALSRELKGLKATARGGPARINAAIPPADTIREAAQLAVARMKVREIRPEVYWSAARRAGQQAIEAAARQDFDAAITAKQHELMSMAVYREASRVKADVEARVQRALDLGRPAARARLGKAGDSYLEQVDTLLDRYDFVRQPGRALDRRESMRVWVQALQAQGLPVEIPDDVIDDLRRIHYSELTTEELIGVSDALDHIVHLARLKNRLLKIADKRELKQTADDLAASIRAHYRGTTDRTIETHLPKEQALRTIGGFFASHRKLASLARQFDGFLDGGPMWEVLLRPLNEAADREAVMNADATRALSAIVQAAYPGREKVRLYEKTHVPAIGISLTKMGRLMVALNWGNEQNRQRIRDGYSWSDAQVGAILDTLDERDWRFVQGTWDFINSYWEEIAAKQKRVTGVVPAKVEAIPVHTKFGTFNGGYFPLRYNERLEAQAGSQLDLEAANLAKQAAYVNATTKRGHTKERVRNVKMKVRLDFGVLFEHVTQVIHDLSHHEMLIDVGRVLGQREVQQAIYDTHGEVIYREIKDGIRDVAFGVVPAVKFHEKAVNHLRQGATIAGLAWNLTTVMLQPFGLTQSAVRIGPKWVARGMSRWLRDAATMENTVSWINERSSFMRLRGQTQQREINEIRNQVGVNTGRVSGWVDDILRTTTRDHVSRQGVADSYFFLIQQMQRIADVPTWLGQYEKAMDAGETEARAIALADQAVLDSQGGGQVKDLAGIQRGGPLLRLWTNFYSFFNTTYNLTVESTKRTNFKKPGQVGRLAVDYFLLYSVPATLGYMLREALKPGDDDEELAEGLIRENLSYLLGTIVGLRELSGTVQGYFGYEGPAGARAFATAARLVKQIEQGEADAAFWRALNDLAGVVFHYPSGQIRRTVEGIAAIAEGDTANPAAVVVGAPR